MKLVHNNLGIQPPRSPISPSPPEVDIPSVDDRVEGFINSDFYNQYGSMFHPPPPPQSNVGFDAMFVGESSAPPEDEWDAPPPSDDWAARLSLDIFNIPPPPSHYSHTGEGGWAPWQ